VPFRATVRLIEWAIAERISRSLFFTVLTGSAVTTILVTPRLVWYIAGLAAVWWIGIAVVAYVIGAPKREAE
jgi:hypothetical protein